MCSYPLDHTFFGALGKGIIFWTLLEAEGGGLHKSLFRMYTELKVFIHRLPLLFDLIHCLAVMVQRHSREMYEKSISNRKKLRSVKVQYIVSFVELGHCFPFNYSH